jgi:hypothetical protein
MGPPSYLRSVFDPNVVMGRIPVCGPHMFSWHCAGEWRWFETFNKLRISVIRENETSLYPLQSLFYVLWFTLINLYLFHLIHKMLLVHKYFNRLTPNDPYMGRIAPLTFKRCILHIYSTNIGTEYFKHALYSPFFLFKMQFVS